ncbi:MAG: hypothetical protein WC679_02220 [Bacteroidales bacterium]
MIKEALQQYNATIDENNVVISSKGKNLGLKIYQKKNRLRYEDATTGTLYASSPVTTTGIEKFVESFWYWTKK